MSLGAIGEHGPNLTLAVARGLENDMAAVGSPTGALVFAAVAGNLANIARGRIHDVNVVIAVRAAPTEGDHLAVRRPGRIDEIALVGQIQLARVSAIGIHHVELGNTATITDENDALASLGVPRRGGAGGGGIGDALGPAAGGVDNEKFGVTEH